MTWQRPSLVAALMAALVGMAGTLSSGCAGEPIDEEDEGLLPSDDFPVEVLAPIEPQGAFYRGSQPGEVLVYDLGPVSVRRNVDGDFAGGRVNPMWVFCDGVEFPPDPEIPPNCTIPRWTVVEDREGFRGIPVVDGQYPIVDEAPGGSTYSPFWEIVYVLVESGFEDNDIKSAETMFLRSDVEVIPTGRIVHCPMIEVPSLPTVPDGATGVAIVQIWYRKFLAECFLLEGGEHLVGDLGLPPFQTRAVRVADERVHAVPAVDAYFPEARIWDEQVAVPDGIIVDVAVDDQLGRYSPLVRVNEIVVRWDYEPGSYDDIEDVDDSIIELRTPEEYRDLPIILGAGR